MVVMHQSVESLATGIIPSVSNIEGENFVADHFSW